MDSKIFMSARLMFTISGCQHCRIWKLVIERYNSKIDLKNRIRVIDCTKYYDFGIIEEPLIRIYSKYIKNTYPVLFFKGRRYDGANTLEEVESILKVELGQEFITEEDFSVITKEGVRLPLLFEGNCEFKKTLFGRKAICT